MRTTDTKRPPRRSTTLACRCGPSATGVNTDRSRCQGIRLCTRVRPGRTPKSVLARNLRRPHSNSRGKRQHSDSDSDDRHDEDGTCHNDHEHRSAFLVFTGDVGARRNLRAHLRHRPCAEEFLTDFRHGRVEGDRILPIQGAHQRLDRLRRPGLQLGRCSACHLTRSRIRHRDVHRSSLLVRQRPQGARTQQSSTKVTLNEQHSFEDVSRAPVPLLHPLIRTDPLPLRWLRSSRKEARSDSGRREDCTDLHGTEQRCHAAKSSTLPSMYQAFPSDASSPVGPPLKKQYAVALRLHAVTSHPRDSARRGPPHPRLQRVRHQRLASPLTPAPPTRSLTTGASAHHG